VQVGFHAVAFDPEASGGGIDHQKDRGSQQHGFNDFTQHMGSPRSIGNGQRLERPPAAMATA
jgi:hypothetical protein